MPDTAAAEVILPQLAAEIVAAGGPVPPDPADTGCVGRTTFDQASSTDLTVTVLLAEGALHQLPSQALVRIESRADNRTYLGTVTAGPFAEPDGLRADSPLLTVTTIRGSGYLPSFHGRVQVTLHGEKLNGALAPPRLRPRPNSPVFALSDAESAAELKCGGDIRLGLVVGREAVEVGIPSARKDVLPRHTAILGTTGGGKSNTVAGLVHRAVEAGMAVVLLDVEGEYTRMDEPADGPLVEMLRDRGLEPAGVPRDQLAVYHLTGREAANPGLSKPFSLQFARLSPYTACELMGANDAQEERFFAAYDLAKRLMRELGVFPEKNKPPEEQEKQAKLLLRLDEFERGYPRLTLSRLLDVVSLCHAAVAKGVYEPFNAEFRADAVKGAIDGKHLPGNAASWGKLKSLLWRLKRLDVFDHRRDGPVRYDELVTPGRLTVIDLSDAGLSAVANLAIADLLRGVQEAQEKAYKAHEAAPTGKPPATLVVVEEAHEFLSKERQADTPAVFDMVGRIAKRGRKRRLGLCFVTQLPAHLPAAVLGLCNGFTFYAEQCICTAFLGTAMTTAASAVRYGGTSRGGTSPHAESGITAAARQRGGHYVARRQHQGQSPCQCLSGGGEVQRRSLSGATARPGRASWRTWRRRCGIGSRQSGGATGSGSARTGNSGTRSTGLRSGWLRHTGRATAGGGGG